jgi:predicted transcriptional regulator
MNILKLRAKMVEKGYNVVGLAKKMGIDKATLYRKLAEGEKFTVGDVQELNKVLDLTKDEAHEIFFS